MIMKLLDIQQRIMGEEDLKTVRTMNDLSSILSDQGRLDEGEQTMLKVLDIRRRLLGDEDFRTLVAMNNVAWILRHQGRLNEAEALILRALGVSVKLLGLKHLTSAYHLLCLSVIYSKQGQFGKELQGRMQIVVTFDRLSDVENSCTIGRMMANLAFTYHHQGRIHDAIEMMQVATIRFRILGDCHPLTIESTNSLADWQDELNGYSTDEVSTMYIFYRLGYTHSNALTQ
jgi:tetratricopeptide (TPR) repeat protein